MDKLERHIKEKLEGRRIDPSPGTWERIADRLGDPKAKKGRSWKIYALAACFAGVFLLGLGRWIIGESGPVEIQRVEVPLGKAPGEREAGPLIPPDQNQGAPPPSRSGADLNGLAQIPEPASEDRPAQREPILAQEAGPGRDTVGEGAFGSDARTLILQKVEEVAARVEDLERLPGGVTDREVDSLLGLAQEQILRDRIFQKSEGVDALALLAEVEAELDESFRDRLFEALKSGYLKLRTALADRNN